MPETITSTEDTATSRELDRVRDRLERIERRNCFLTFLLAAAAVGAAVTILGKLEPKRPTVENLRKNGVI